MGLSGYLTVGPQQPAVKARFADRELRAPAWRALHAAGDPAVGRLARGLLVIFRTFVERFTVSEIELAVSSGGVLAEHLLELDETMTDALVALVQTTRTGGEVGAQLLERELNRPLPHFVRRQAAVEFGFDVDRPEALAAAQAQAARLVRQIQDEVRQALRELIAVGIREGRQVRHIARDIREAGLLGLDARRARAVDNLRLALARAGRAQVFIDRTVARYAERLLRQRALTIARHETLLALHTGQQEAWRQAREHGLLRPTSMRRWLATGDDRTCPICAPMNGQERGLEEAFVSPYNQATALHPPIHVQCRCAVGIASRPGRA